MEFRILGPLEVRDGSKTLSLGGAKQRALLAILLINANQVVATDRLVELLWGGEPPASGEHIVQVYVSQLRKILEPKHRRGAPHEVLISRPPGYLLHIEADQLDLGRFERFVDEGRQGLSAESPETAARVFRDALSLWRGSPLADVAGEPFAVAEAARLTELRLRALEQRIEADLALGRHSDMVAELQALVGEHALRERLHEHLMLALYRSGRQAEACDVYQRMRKDLEEQMGMDPGPELQRLLKQILNQDPSLVPPTMAPPRSKAPTSSPLQPVMAAASRSKASESPSGQPLIAPPSRQERKVVSVLFCDVVGFTATSERADPEDVQARIAPYHERVRRELQRYGGTVEKFTGDAVMAVFGAPVAHEDDAERAVRAGLAVLEALAELNAAKPDLALSVRVGVNTGEAVVSVDARAEPGDAMVVGDVVNTAARIQSAAPVDAIAVGEGTFRATERVFVYEPLNPIIAKGKADPVAVWRPIAARGRFGSDLVRAPTTPLVGRELELLQLRTAFDRVARERTVQLVTIVGEPGVGKSRLVAELFTYIEGLEELVPWRQGRCLPYGEGITFWALGEIVKAHAAIYESDSAEAAAAKLEAVLPEDGARPWLRARLLPLLGVESNPAAQEEAFAAWRRFLESIAEQGPAVLVFEDVHWADEALLAFLEHLTDWAQGVPLLLVCTARPELYETRPGWGAGLANRSTIRLAPLSDVDTARLVSALLEQAVLPIETQQRLLERSGGNPLYAEEFVRLLRDRSLLDKRGTIKPRTEVPLPDTLQALIAARLDTLSPARKQLLQDAAVIGKVFWAGALVDMGDRDAREVEAALHALARKELMRQARRSSMEGESEYSFWHLLIRDVAYGQIPRAERAAKHVRAASWLEAKAGDRIEDLADVLAHHTGEALSLAQASGNGALAAELTSAAARYALMAGERALGLDVSKARVLLDRARRLTSQSDPRFPFVLRRWAQAEQSSGRLAEAADALEQAIAAFQARGDRRGAGETLARLAVVHHKMGKPGQVEMAEQAVAILEQEPGAELVYALAELALSHLHIGAPSVAFAVAERAIQLAQRLSLSVPAEVLGEHGLYRCYLGQLDGLAEMERALELSVAEGKGNSAAWLHNNLGLMHGILEGPVAAVAHYEQGQAFAEARGLVEVTRIIAVNRVWALVQLGQLDKVLEQAEALAASLREGGSLLYLGYLRGSQAMALAELGKDLGVAGEEALRIARDTDDPIVFTEAVAAAATSVLSAGNKAAVIGLLAEIAPGDFHNAPDYAFSLPALARSAAQFGDPELVAQLASNVTSKLPIQLHALATARALEAEAIGDYRRAAELHADAASRWEGFGNRLEQAHALLGEGRCLTAVGDAAADLPLRKARALFADMRARPRVVECDSLINQTARLSS